MTAAWVGRRMTARREGVEYDRWGGGVEYDCWVGRGDVDRQQV